MGTVTRLVSVEINTHLEANWRPPRISGPGWRWWSDGHAGEHHAYPGGEGIYPQQPQGHEAHGGQQELAHRHQIEALGSNTVLRGTSARMAPTRAMAWERCRRQIVHRGIHKVGQGELEEHPYQPHLHGDDAGVEQHLSDGLLGVGLVNREMPALHMRMRVGMMNREPRKRPLSP